MTRHSLPESPPDSSSEHPYSPQDTCEQQIGQPEAIYTTLGQPLYKQQNLLNPIMTDNLILGSHIVVSENADGHLLDNGGILMSDGRIIQEVSIVIFLRGRYC